MRNSQKRKRVVEDYSEEERRPVRKRKVENSGRRRSPSCSLDSEEQQESKYFKPLEERSVASETTNGTSSNLDATLLEEDYSPSNSILNDTDDEDSYYEHNEEEEELCEQEEDKEEQIQIQEEEEEQPIQIREEEDKEEQIQIQEDEEQPIQIQKMMTTSPSYDELERQLQREEEKNMTEKEEENSDENSEDEDEDDSDSSYSINSEDEDTEEEYVIPEGEGEIDFDYEDFGEENDGLRYSPSSSSAQDNQSSSGEEDNQSDVSQRSQSSSRSSSPQTHHHFHSSSEQQQQEEEEEEKEEPTIDFLSPSLSIHTNPLPQSVSLLSPISHHIHSSSHSPQNHKFKNPPVISVNVQSKNDDMPNFSKKQPIMSSPSSSPLHTATSSPRKKKKFVNRTTRIYKPSKDPKGGTDDVEILMGEYSRATPSTILHDYSDYSRSTNSKNSSRSSRERHEKKQHKNRSQNSRSVSKNKNTKSKTRHREKRRERRSSSRDRQRHSRRGKNRTEPKRKCKEDKSRREKSRSRNRRRRRRSRSKSEPREQENRHNRRKRDVTPECITREVQKKKIFKRRPKANAQIIIKEIKRLIQANKVYWLKCDQNFYNIICKQFLQYRPKEIEQIIFNTPQFLRKHDSEENFSIRWVGTGDNRFLCIRRDICDHVGSLIRSCAHSAMDYWKMTDGYHELLKKTYPQLSANLKSNILKSKMFNVMAQGNDVYIKLNSNQMQLYMESSSYSQHSKETQLQKCKNPYLISQRQKQINFGKNTEGYKTYLRLVPKRKRRMVLAEKDRVYTPDATLSLSKRRYDGAMRAWRRALHLWDGRTEIPPRFG